MNWAGAPELGAVVMLATAFASIVKRCHSYVSRTWMAGWYLIVVHFLAHFLRLSLPFGNLFFQSLGLFTLVWAAFLFMFSAEPYRKTWSLYWIGGSAAAVTTLYLTLELYLPIPERVQMLGAILVGVVPFSVALLTKGFHHPLRRLTATLFVCLSVFLVTFKADPQNSHLLITNAVLFALFFGCSFHLWYSYPRATAGAFVTITGFFAWSAAFAMRIFLLLHPPQSAVESGVWHLPTYIVAVGMMLLLLEEQIDHNQYLALHDELTQLPNRRLFQDRLCNAIERARRAETQTALLVVDLDNFKEINDQYGHATGDAVLRHVSSIFAGRVRKSDTVSRTGGDEFCIILEAPTSRADALQVSQLLLLLLSAPLRIGDDSIYIGASIGVALYPDDAYDADTLCIAADQKMYENKREKQRRQVGEHCPFPGEPLEVEYSAGQD